MLPGADIGMVSRVARRDLVHEDHGPPRNAGARESRDRSAAALCRASRLSDRSFRLLLLDPLFQPVHLGAVEAGLLGDLADRQAGGEERRDPRALGVLDLLHGPDRPAVDDLVRDMEAITKNLPDTTKRTHEIEQAQRARKLARVVRAAVAEARDMSGPGNMSKGSGLRPSS